MWKPLALLALVTSVGGCVAPAARPGLADIVADGRAIAETQCAGCHALGARGESPVAQAPPFRTVLAHYRIEALESDLIEGIRVNHEMPAFRFDPEGTDSLIAYLKSIQTGDPDASPDRRTP